jgi:hypothetical protein
MQSYVTIWRQNTLSSNTTRTQVGPLVPKCFTGYWKLKKKKAICLTDIGNNADISFFYDKDFTQKVPYLIVLRN